MTKSNTAQAMPDNQPTEDFSLLLEEAFSKNQFKPGTVTKGTIIGFEKDLGFFEKRRIRNRLEKAIESAIEKHQKLHKK